MVRVPRCNLISRNANVSALEVLAINRFAVRCLSVIPASLPCPHAGIPHQSRRDWTVGRGFESVILNSLQSRIQSAHASSSRISLALDIFCQD